MTYGKSMACSQPEILRSRKAKLKENKGGVRTAYDIPTLVILRHCRSVWGPFIIKYLPNVSHVPGTELSPDYMMITTLP